MSEATIWIAYHGPFAAVDVPDIPVTGLKPGIPIEVSAELGKRLLGQTDNWRTSSKPASAKKTEE